MHETRDGSNCRERTKRGADWPFGYDELEPWYQLAEEILSVGGDTNAEGPPRSGGYPLPPYVWTAHESELASNFHTIHLTPGHMPIARFRRCMTTGTCKYCPIGARYSAQDHMDALLHDRTHRNLEVVINAPVRRIIAGRTRAYGVEHFDPVVEDWKTVHADKVVICAGTYESTKLLLASISPEWPTGIGNRYDQVGRHIVTHLLFSVEGERDINSRMLFQEYDFPTLMSRSWDTEARQRDGKIFVFNNRSLPKMEFEKLMIKGHDRASIVAAAGGTMRAGLSAFIEEFGQPSNRLTIAPGVGKFRLPKTNISFTRYNSTEFNATIDKARQDLTECLKSLGYTEVENRPPEFPRGDHASGTCRMGDRPDKSVTDANLAVHGFDNLFVCSNAVLPNAAAVNPTLTLAALALRLGTHLSERSHC